MADYTKMIPFILKWETSVEINKGEALESYFLRARKKGFANDPQDHGGATCCGIILATYKEFRQHMGLTIPTADDLRNISFQEWKMIFKTMFWDRWQGDNIKTQAIANLLVDWVWASGNYGITKPQKLLGLTTDGVVGQKTLAAVNAGDQPALFTRLKHCRVDYVCSIVDRSVAAYERKVHHRASEKEKLANTQYKFKSGWLRRINAINYKSLG